jgi:hypothetical protein
MSNKVGVFIIFLNTFLQIAARRAFTADGSFPDRYSCLRISAGFIFAIRRAIK